MVFARHPLEQTRPASRLIGGSRLCCSARHLHYMRCRCLLEHAQGQSCLALPEFGRYWRPVSTPFPSGTLLALIPACVPGNLTKLTCAANAPILRSSPNCSLTGQSLIPGPRRRDAMLSTSQIQDNRPQATAHLAKTMSYLQLASAELE